MSAISPSRDETKSEHQNENDIQVDIDHSRSNVTATPASDFHRLVSAACAEVETSALGVDAHRVDQVVDIICGTTPSSSSTRQLVVFGVGRERLAMHGFAMRLHHLGVGATVACVHDMTTPRVTKDDCVLVSAGPGYFATVDAIVRVAKRDGAKTVCFTAKENGSTPRMCDVVVRVPAATMEEREEDGDGEKEQRIDENEGVHDEERNDNRDRETRRDVDVNSEKKIDRSSSCLPMGSAYEGALFILFEVIVELCRRRLGVSHTEMASRHTNLE